MEDWSANHFGAVTFKNCTRVGRLLDVEEVWSWRFVDVGSNPGPNTEPTVNFLLLLVVAKY